MSILSRSLQHSPNRANFSGSGTGFWELNYAGEARDYLNRGYRVAGRLVGWLSCCVGVIDGAEQCSVLQVISGGNDGIIHRHSCWAGFGCWLFSFFSY